MMGRKNWAAIRDKHVTPERQAKNKERAEGHLDADAIRALAEEWVRIAEERGATPLDLMKTLEFIVDTVDRLTS